jgi:very-short-patch-repair endonuclease
MSTRRQSLILAAPKRRQMVLRARELRAGPTRGEAALWNELRGNKLEGIRFRRQHPIGRFVLDFFAPRIQLAIEIDGPMHQGREAYDARRQATLEAAGIQFLRFTADEVELELPRCLERIRDFVRAYLGFR